MRKSVIEELNNMNPKEEKGCKHRVIINGSCGECNAPFPKDKYKYEMPHTEEKEWENKLKSEASIFWSKIAENLPKSLERSALGDEKIFRAFYPAYKEFPTLTE